MQLLSCLACPWPKGAAGEFFPGLLDKLHLESPLWCICTQGGGEQEHKGKCLSGEEERRPGNVIAPPVRRRADL